MNNKVILQQIMDANNSAADLFCKSFETDYFHSIVLETEPGAIALVLPGFREFRRICDGVTFLRKE